MDFDVKPRFGRRADENGMNLFSEAEGEGEGQSYLPPHYDPAAMERDWTVKVDDLPPAIRDFLVNMFSPVALSAAAIEWVPDETSGYYQIDIVSGQGDISLFFSKEGELIEYDMQLLKSDLPVPVRKALTKLAPKKIHTTMVVEMRMYEVDYTDSKGEAKTAQFDPRGKLMGITDTPMMPDSPVKTLQVKKAGRNKNNNS